MNCVVQVCLSGAVFLAVLVAVLAFMLVTMFVVFVCVIVGGHASTPPGIRIPTLRQSLRLFTAVARCQ